MPPSKLIATKQIYPKVFYLFRGGCIIKGGRLLSIDRCAGRTILQCSTSPARAQTPRRKRAAPVQPRRQRAHRTTCIQFSLSLSLSVCTYIYIYIYIYNISLSIYISLSLYIYIYMYLSIYQSIYLSIYLSHHAWTCGPAYPCASSCERRARDTLAHAARLPRGRIRGRARFRGDCLGAVNRRSPRDARRDLGMRFSDAGSWNSDLPAWVHTRALFGGGLRGARAAPPPGSARGPPHGCLRCRGALPPPPLAHGAEGLSWAACCLRPVACGLGDSTRLPRA